MSHRGQRTLRMRASVDHAGVDVFPWMRSRSRTCGWRSPGTDQRCVDDDPPRSPAWIGFLPRLSPDVVGDLLHRLGCGGGLEMISTSGITGTGLKKCTPTTRDGSATSLDTRMMGIDEVLVARIVSFGVTLSRSAKNDTLRFSISGSASMTSSRSLKSSTVVVVLNRASAASASDSLSLPRLTPRARDAAIRARRVGGLLVTFEDQDLVAGAGRDLGDSGAHGASADHT